MNEQLTAHEELIRSYQALSSLVERMEISNNDWANDLFEELNNPTKENLIFKIKNNEESSELIETLSMLQKDDDEPLKIENQPFDQVQLQNDLQHMGAIVDKAKQKGSKRMDTLLAGFEALKQTQKTIATNAINKYVHDTGLNKLDTRITELEQLIAKIKSNIREKKAQYSARQAESSMSAEDLRHKYEQDIEETIRNLVAGIDRSKAELEHVEARQQQSLAQIERMKGELSVLLHEVDHEERESGGAPDQQHIHFFFDLDALTNSATVSGDGSVGGGGLITQQAVDDSLATLEAVTQENAELLERIAHAEDAVSARRAELKGVLKREDSKALERLKKMTRGLESKVESDKRRVALLELLVRQIEKDDSGGGGGGVSAGGDAMRQRRDSALRSSVGVRPLPQIEANNKQLESLLNSEGDFQTAASTMHRNLYRQYQVQHAQHMQSELVQPRPHRATTIVHQLGESNSSQTACSVPGNERELTVSPQPQRSQAQTTQAKPLSTVSEDFGMETRFGDVNGAADNGFGTANSPQHHAPDPYPSISQQPQPPSTLKPSFSSPGAASTKRESYSRNTIVSQSPTASQNCAGPQQVQSHTPSGPAQLQQPQLHHRHSLQPHHQAIRASADRTLQFPSVDASGTANAHSGTHPSPQQQPQFISPRTRGIPSMHLHRIQAATDMFSHEQGRLAATMTGGGAPIFNLAGGSLSCSGGSFVAAAAEANQLLPYIIRSTQKDPAGDEAVDRRVAEAMAEDMTQANEAGLFVAPLSRSSLLLHNKRMTVQARHQVPGGGRTKKGSVVEKMAIAGDPAAAPAPVDHITSIESAAAATIAKNLRQLSTRWRRDQKTGQSPQKESTVPLPSGSGNNDTVDGISDAESPSHSPTRRRTMRQSLLLRRADAIPARASISSENYFRSSVVMPGGAGGAGEETASMAPSNRKSIITTAASRMLSTQSGLPRASTIFQYSDANRVVVDGQESEAAEYYTRTFGYKTALEQLNALLNMLTNYNSNHVSALDGQVAFSRTAEEELESVEALRTQIGFYVHKIKHAYHESRNAQAILKDIQSELGREHRLMEAARANLLAAVEGAKWPHYLRPGEYQAEAEACRARIRDLRMKVRSWESRVQKKRRANMRLSTLLTSDRAPSQIFKQQRPPQYQPLVARPPPHLEHSSQPPPPMASAIQPVRMSASVQQPTSSSARTHVATAAGRSVDEANSAHLAQQAQRAQPLPASPRNTAVRRSQLLTTNTSFRRGHSTGGRRGGRLSTESDRYNPHSDDYYLNQLQADVEAAEAASEGAAYTVAGNRLAIFHDITELYDQTLTAVRAKTGESGVIETQSVDMAADTDHDERNSATARGGASETYNNRDDDDDDDDDNDDGDMNKVGPDLVNFVPRELLR